MRRIPTRGRSAAPKITVGLIAHDPQKEALARFIRAHHPIASRIHFLAPEDTATAVAQSDLDIEVLAPDTQGGDLQLAAAVVEGRLDAVIFFNDPLAALPSEPQVSTILKVCDLEMIPLATNISSAEILVHYLGQIADRAEHPASVGDEHEDEHDRTLVLTGPWLKGGTDPAAHR